jgi:uncharacterized protein YpmB
MKELLIILVIWITFSLFFTIFFFAWLKQIQKPESTAITEAEIYLNLVDKL